MKEFLGGGDGITASGLALGGVLLAFGLCGIVGGVRVQRWARSQQSVCVKLCADGFLVDVSGREFPFHWDEIDSVEESYLRRHPDVRSFLIQRSDGESFAVNRLLESHDELVDVIREQTVSRNIPWEVTEQD